jgi:type IV pilus assembly protein PilW
MANLCTRQRGLTITELMIAITLGALIVTAVVAMYLSTSRTFSQDERFAVMQENGRYALRTVAEDLTMVDFWGKLVGIDIATTTLTDPTGCGANAGIFDGTTAILFNNYHGVAPVTMFAPCAALTGVQQPNTDVLVVKRVEGGATARTFVDTADTDGDLDLTEVIVEGDGDLVDDVVYLRTNGVAGQFIDDASAANTPNTGESDWRYIPRIYFVRNFYETAGDGIPALCRMDLVGDDMGAVSVPPNGTVDGATCIAEGVEDFHLQFGIDTDNDSYANQYLATPTVAQLEGVVSARLYLLLRSRDPDPSPAYQNTKTYRLGDVIANGGAAFNDKFYRRVYSTTVMLRNPINLNQVNN